MWEAELAGSEAATGYTVQGSCGHTRKAVLEDVAFGEVWLCSGQSNMGINMGGILNSEEEISSGAGYPDIRLAQVSKLLHVPALATSIHSQEKTPA